jgi:hypothetical protein
MFIVWENDDIEKGLMIKKMILKMKGALNSRYRDGILSLSWALANEK